MLLGNQPHWDSFVAAKAKNIVSMRYLFSLVHFPKGDYPGKLTQREMTSEKELSEHLDSPKEKQRLCIKLQKTIPVTLSQYGKTSWQSNCPELERKQSNINNDPMRNVKQAIVLLSSILLCSL